MLEGLRERSRHLEARNIGALALMGSPVDVVPRIARRAAMVITDRGYLRHQKSWRDEVAARLSCPFVEVGRMHIVAGWRASPRKSGVCGGHAAS
jgi:deoxyribodipyrimidine photo-lyase